MSRGTLNVILLILLVATVAVTWLGAPDTGRRNFEYFPNMARSPRYNGFSPNPNFPDGKTLREPVPGTLPRGFVPLHYTASKEDALRAGEELVNPCPSGDRRALDRGGFVFANFCQECHGAGGTGNGPVSMRGFPAPASLVADRARNMKDGQMFHILTFGQNNMPSYAAQVSPDDRWKAILYVRSLQKQATAPSPATGPQPLTTQATPNAPSSSGGQP